MRLERRVPVFFTAPSAVKELEGKTSTGPLQPLVLFSESKPWWFMYKSSETAQMHSSLVEWKLLSSVWFFVTPWTIQFMEFSRPEHWSGFSPVQFSHLDVSDSLRPHGLQHARLPCSTLAPGVYSISCLSSWWCHPINSSSVVPFSSHLQSFPASGSFPMSQLFTSGGQSIGASASTLVLPMNTQDWSPLGRTGWISLQSKGLSRVFSNTTVQKHQFFGS